MANRLLILDVGNEQARKTAQYFAKKDWSTEVCHSLQEIIAQFDQHEFDPHVLLIYVTDNTWDFDAIKAALGQHLDFCEVIVSIDSTLKTEWEQQDVEQDDLVYEIFPHHEKPSQLTPVLKRALRTSLTHRRLHKYTSVEKHQYNIGAFVGNSETAANIRAMFKQLVNVPLSTLIITGETGTGKGLAARILHFCGQRAGEPIVELNCAALPKELLESQLFGHEAGAFTGAKGRHRGLFEQADGGTLFLDEIGDMDLDLQAKLLKAIEDKKIRRLGSEREIHVDVQIFAATGVDLQLAVHENRFREDLFHRLNVFNIALPPLRERKNDLLELVPLIVAEFNQTANKNISTISDEVWEKLLAYNWPGNIRELRNVIERCVLMSNSEDFPVAWLQLDNNGLQPKPTQNTALDDKSIRIPLDGSMTLDDIERHIIEKILEEYDFNVSESAKALGATRETLRYRIQKYGIKKDSRE